MTIVQTQHLMSEHYSKTRSNMSIVPDIIIKINNAIQLSHF